MQQDDVERRLANFPLDVVSLFGSSLSEVTRMQRSAMREQMNYFDRQSLFGSTVRLAITGPEAFRKLELSVHASRKKPFYKSHTSQAFRKSGVSLKVRAL